MLVTETMYHIGLKKSDIENAKYAILPGDPGRVKTIAKFLTNVKKNNYFGNDSQKIEYLYNEIKKAEIILPSIEKLEELQKIEIELEIKYNELNELGTYFTHYI